jgi:hypothetical protein
MRGAARRRAGRPGPGWPARRAEAAVACHGRGAPAAPVRGQGPGVSRAARACGVAREVPAGGAPPGSNARGYGLAGKDDEDGRPWCSSPEKREKV